MFLGHVRKKWNLKSQKLIPDVTGPRQLHVRGGSEGGDPHPAGHHPSQTHEGAATKVPDREDCRAGKHLNKVQQDIYSS